MSYWDKKLIREQLDSKFLPLREFAFSSPPQGDRLKTLRLALGMSANDLAQKAGIDQSRISRIENSEKEGNVKLSTLQKIAESLDMVFVYGFVPRSGLEDMVQQQARKIALERLKRLNHTMSLELQELSADEKERTLQDMIQKILIDEPKDFWNK